MNALRNVALVAAVLVLTACGSSSGDHAAHGGDESIAAPVDGAPAVTVTATDIDFAPATLELAAGETVNLTVTNDGQAMHDFTLEVADIHVNVEPGESQTTALTIDEPGTYEAVCTVDGHAEAGMTVEVVVT